MRPDLPPGRYDAPSRRARVLAGLISGVLGVAALLAVYGAYDRYNEGKLRAEVIGYDVRSDALVQITFEVNTGDRRGECRVRARNRAGAEAGSQLVQVSPNGKQTQRVTVDLATTSRAVSGELVGCRAR